MSQLSVPSELSVPSRPPGARPGCHILFFSHPLAFIHRHCPSVQYTKIQIIHRLILEGSSTRQRCLYPSPAFYGTIIIPQTGLGSPPLSSLVAEYINAANITGLLKQTDRYLLWEANPKQYTPLSWLSWLYNWRTHWLTETQWGLEALVPRCRLLIHLDGQQWSLILWSPCISVGIDCVEYLRTVSHTSPRFSL